MSGTWIMVSLIGVLGSADDNALLEPQVGPYPRRPLVTSTVSNVEPRRTVEGGVVNAHDSGVVQDPASGTFYLYGISFGTNCTDFNNCAAACGHDMKSTGVGFVAYSSASLSGPWKLEATQLTRGFGGGDCFKLHRNPTTKRYIAVWRGGCPRGTSPPSQTCAMAAESTAPVGPFANPVVLALCNRSSQAGFHVDQNGKGWAWCNTYTAPHWMYSKQCVHELTDDWMNSTGRFSCWMPRDGWGLEGGALWDRNGTYYFAAGSPSCNAKLGGDARVWTASDPMAEWTYQTNINPLQRQIPGYSNTEPPPPPLPPAKLSRCDVAGDWVGSMFVNEGGQPLRGGLHVVAIGAGRYNFTQSQPHSPQIEGVGTLTQSPAGGWLIAIESGLSQNLTARVDSWPQTAATSCSRISWSNGGIWGKLPVVPESRFHVQAQMFGVSTLHVAGGGTVHMYTGERYQTGDDGQFASGYSYWQPLTYDENGVVQRLPVGGLSNFTLTFES